MAREPAALLSSEWINARTENVLDMTMAIVSHLIDQLTSSGYWPLESPVTPADLGKMTPDQLQDYIAGIPTVEGKAAVMNELNERNIPKTLVPNI